jgi:hypothetical protein
VRRPAAPAVREVRAEDRDDEHEARRAPRVAGQNERSAGSATGDMTGVSAKPAISAIAAAISAS